MLTRGELVPHFTVETVDGREVRYSNIWQQRNLALVLATPRGADADLSSLTRRSAEFAEAETELVVTRDAVARLPQPGVVVSDRWGEIVYIESLEGTLPSPDELLDWVRYTQMRCPECEGETR